MVGDLGLLVGKGVTKMASGRLEVSLPTGGHSKTDSMFLIKNGACGVVEGTALHLETKFGHAPKSVANAFVESNFPSPFEVSI